MRFQLWASTVDHKGLVMFNYLLFFILFYLYFSLIPRPKTLRYVFLTLQKKGKSHQARQTK